MNRISIRKMGFSVALTGTILYLACIILMLTAGQEGTITFFNSLLHGIDVSSVIRMDVPLLETLIGIVQTFVIGWFIGASIAVFYNAQFRPKS